MNKNFREMDFLVVGLVWIILEYYPDQFSFKNDIWSFGLNDIPNFFLQDFGLMMKLRGEPGNSWNQDV